MIKGIPAPDEVTAFAIRVGAERLHPTHHTPDYLCLNDCRKRFEEWLKRVPGHQLRALDVGGRIQPYRPMLNGRLAMYVAIDPQKTGLVDVIAVGERLPFANATFDLALCTGVLCYVEDPPRVIKEIYGVLRPGGSLLLRTPAIESGLRSRLDFVSKQPSSTAELGDCDQVLAQLPW